MKLTASRILIISLVVAVVITAFTGLFYNRLAFSPGVCSAHGYPLGWIQHGECGQISPPSGYQILPIGLVIDIITWFIVSVVIAFIAKRLSDNKK